MHILEPLSNPSAPLQAVFDALPDEPIEASASPELPVASGRLGNGVVQRAVVKVLAAAGQPMRLRAIHSAVEDLLGCTVSKESVGWCLRTCPLFDRVAYGCYGLVPQT